MNFFKVNAAARPLSLTFYQPPPSKHQSKAVQAPWPSARPPSLKQSQVPWTEAMPTALSLLMPPAGVSFWCLHTQKAPVILQSQPSEPFSDTSLQEQPDPSSPKPHGHGWEPGGVALLFWGQDACFTKDTAGA